MRQSDFSRNATGSLVDVEGGKAFLPYPLPPAAALDSKAIRLATSKADGELGRLDGTARQIERPELLFRNYLRREAVLSSAIEGTHTTLAGLVLYEASAARVPDDDAKEVSNYLKALEYGLQRCKEISIGRHLLLELHQALMEGTNAAKTTPGKFRDCQVVVGLPPIETARFVPPPFIYVDDLIENLCSYIAAEDEPLLVQLAVAHYQFETIHPFRDGNGRIGRLLIALALMKQDLLTAPMLYLSAYLERHRDEYYNNLLLVSQDGRWEDWIVFFLKGVAEQARDTVLRTDRLAALRKEYQRKLSGAQRSTNLLVLIDALYTIPGISIPQAADVLGVTYAAAKASVEKLQDAGILSRVERRRGAQFFLATGILDVLDMSSEQLIATT